MSDPHEAPLLGPSQRRITGYALTVVACLCAVAAIATAFVALARFVGYFSGVLWPLAVAGVLALVLRPLVDVLHRKWKLRRLTSVLLIFAAFVLVFGGLLALILPPLIGQLVDFVEYLPVVWADGQKYLQANYPKWISSVEAHLQNPMVQKAKEALAAQGRDLLTNLLPTLQSAGGSVLGFFSVGAHAVVIPVYLFFFLLSGGDATKGLPGHLAFLKPAVRDDIVFLVREFIGIVESFFRGQLLIALILGAVLSTGFSLVGLKFGLFIGLAMGLLNIVPYLGTIVGITVAMPLAFFQTDGGWSRLGFVALVMVLAQCLEGWFLTPRIMGKRTGLHPVVIMVAVFFWGTAFNSLLGMLLAIPLTAFFVTAWRLALRRFSTN